MKTKIIADLTSNHMGDMQVIEAMIRNLADHGVDVVKTQSWRADNLRKDFPDYDMNYRYYKQHELSDEDHFKIKEFCDHYGIQMLTTCFDVDRVDFLASLGLATIKVASSDMAGYRMIRRLLDRFEEVIISTGAATECELERTMEICRGGNAVFLHCMAYYPCPLEKVNMERMLFLKEKGFRAGYSDHTLGTEAGKYAICLGAEYVEKHFTLNRCLPGRDQKMSATIEELSDLVLWANLVESMRGASDAPLSDVEIKFRNNYVGKWGDNA